ncbi:endonuclease/exonuclease/phosphatase family protein [Longibacter sp.]|uniref:endonuclease/exonuclease/phosphatase family protein n=1 Tax=Longibacter sp. TaxID=2045415 RepID=UPI003EC0ACF6
MTPSHFSRSQRIPAVVLCLLLLLSGCHSGDSESANTSHPAAIAIDGTFGDWDTVPALARDRVGDGTSLDLTSLTLAHDDTYLFVTFGLDAPTILQENNDLTLALDLDADASTGNADGFEITWTFGERSGTFFGANDERLGHADLGFTSLPTVASKRYEVALDRSAAPGGQEWLATGSSVCAALIGGGDRVPDAGKTCYSLASASPNPHDDPVDLARPQGTQVRFMTHNVLRDTIFTDPVLEPYQRIYQAVAPDVYALQEVYEHGAVETRRRVAELAGTSAGDWYASKLGLDLVVVSRFPISAEHTIPGFEGYESGAFLLDTRDALGHPIVMVNMHPPCCTGGDPDADMKRQQVADAVAAFMRDTRADGGPLDAPAETPIVVMGDMNFVGDAQQPQTMVTGAIQNTSVFGSSGSTNQTAVPLIDVNPSQTGSPFHTTWENPGSSFPPGRLDYAYLSRNAAPARNAYVLNTRHLPDSVRSAANLRAGDTAAASDHLPIVVDLGVDDS